ncbi:hypothetical protein EYZ11_012712 [Aspergillus tanneri]|uniref:PiggyBac transposable element-derived protein domain-containing protein n=1 Tax=Aspergillus tanneri TaxID=1220188 RepID=A0A4S3J4X3_9EURO|nr:hypothetical protein EYZ11_012712 [Aspergillus tanneri]
MPNKPIKQGYKLYAIAASGYIYYFIWSSKKHGQVEITHKKGLTNTGSMVAQLVRRLEAIEPGLYTIYLDNYFTSIPLFKKLRDKGYGACGTTRPHLSGKKWPKMITELKDQASKLPWGTIYGEEVDGVLCIG